MKKIFLAFAFISQFIISSLGSAMVLSTLLALTTSCEIHGQGQLSVLQSFPHPSIPQNAYTTTDNKQIIGVIGNSTASYASTGGPGTAPTAGTAFEWDGATLNNLGTSLINSGVSGTHKGDWTTNFATLYNTATGYKPIFVDGHIYGSLCYSSTDPNAWISTGFVRGNYLKNWVRKATTILSAQGLTQMKAIYLGDILINDASGAETTADINTAFNALIAFLQADFPGTPIYAMLMAQNAAFAQSLRTTTVRINALNSIPGSYTDVHWFYHGAYIFSYGGQDSADKHWNQDANDHIARSFNDFLLDTESNWETRRIRNQFYDQLTVTQRGYVKTFMDSMTVNGLYVKLNYFITDVQTTQKNHAMDWIGVTSPRTDVGGYTFNAKASIETTGSNTYEDTFIVPLWMQLHGGQDDAFMLTKVGTNNTAAGTIGTLFGATSSGSLSLSQLTTSRLQYKCNDNTASTYLTDTKFADNTWYGVGRDASNNKILIKGSSSVATATVTSTAVSAVIHPRGARNTNPQDVLNATFTGALIFGQYSGMNFTKLESFIDALNTNMAL